jgi:hypothetical protein
LKLLQLFALLTELDSVLDTRRFNSQHDQPFVITAARAPKYLRVWLGLPGKLDRSESHPRMSWDEDVLLPAPSSGFRVPLR